LNRYPACPISSEIFGLVPHTDSDFLTILSQDEVGGLQLMKDSKWVAVNPNQDALIVNIGDLFQVKFKFYIQFSLACISKLRLDKVSLVTN
jgi:gibberellin 2-oxidase